MSDDKPPQKIAIQCGDELIEDTVHSVRYTSTRPEIRQHPTGWRKWLRAITPRRWRKPLPVVRPHQPAGMEIITEGGVQAERERRHYRIMQDMNRALGEILR